METPYILFQAGSLKFLILMEYVAVIEPAGKILDKSIPIYDFGRICRLGKCAPHGNYILVLNVDEKRIGMITEMVEGIRSVDSEAVLALDPPALCEKNRYLSGAVPVEGGEPPLVYILDAAGLYEKAAAAEPDGFL